MTPQEMADLSAAFRAKCSTLSTAARNELENTIMYTFGIQNRRNVQLWTRAGSQQRNIVSDRINSEEARIRITFVRAFLEAGIQNSPQKGKSFDQGAYRDRGAKLREYLTNEYIGGGGNSAGCLNKITVGSDGVITIQYDSYPGYEEFAYPEETDDFNDIYEPSEWLESDDSYQQGELF